MTDIRKEYFKLINDLRTKKEGANDLESDNLESIINQSNLLFQNIENSIELKLDARISAETVNHSSLNFEKKLRNRKISSELFIQHLNRNFKEVKNKKIEEENKTKLNTFFYEINKNFFGIKFKEFFTISNEDKIVKKRESNVKDEVSSKSTTQMEFNQMQADHFETKLKKLISSIGNQKINYFKIVLNPKSFTETIENIFFLSFAIKLKKLKFECDKNMIYISQFKEEIKTHEKEPEIKHFACSIDFNEYQTLCKNLKIKKAFLNLN